MSVKAMNWVWESSRTVGNDRLVLLAIADRASDDGLDAWPSVKTLAKKTKLHERTVQRCLRSIENIGELEIRLADGPRGSNLYVLRMDALPLEASPPQRQPQPRGLHRPKHWDPGKTPPGGKLSPGDSSAGGGVAPSPPGGDTRATGGVTPAPPDSSCTSGTTGTSKTRTAASPRDLAREPNANGNYDVVEKLAFDLATQGWWEHRGVRYVIDSEQTLVDALKDECARLRMDRGTHPSVNPDIIHDAAASEWFKRHHPERVARSRASA